jgi:hypothetical protein
VDGSVPREYVLPCTLRVSQTGYPDIDLPFGIEVGRLTAVDPIPDGPRQPALYYAYDNADSSYTEAPQFEWVEISGVGTRLSLSDDDVEVVSLGAFGPFVFYGQSYSQITVCSNGFVCPGSQTYSGYSNQELPYSSAPAMLAMNWDDWYPPTGGGVWYHNDAANHRFVVEWDSVHYYSSSDWDRMQVVLYDTTLAAGDGNSEFCYQYLTANRVNSSTVGEQDPTRAIFIQALFDESYHRAAAELVPGRAVKFTTDGPATGVSELDPAGAGMRLALSPSANPFRSSVLLRFSLPRATAARLSVYDAAGRVVRRLVDTGSGTMAAGLYQVRWDGRDDAGRALAAGIFFYRLEAGEETLSRKAVIAR